jgi:ABC-type glycerol-3-phosphate transport system substrate-binding protein
MQKLTGKKLVCLLLAVLTVFGSTTVVLAADESDSESGDSYQRLKLADLGDTLATVSYEDYEAANADIPLGKGEVAIDATDVDYDEDENGESLTTAKVEVKTGVFGKSGEVLFVPDVGKVTWKFDLPAAGRYSIKVEYAAANDSKTSIERVFKINGEVPFTSSRSIAFKKTWTFDYATLPADYDPEAIEDESQRQVVRENTDKTFILDLTGNETRPDAVWVQCWTEVLISDKDTYVQMPYVFAFKEGENTITFEGSRDSMYIASITLCQAEEIPTYGEVRGEWAEKGYTEGTAKIKIQGEIVDVTSNYSIYPDYDRSSAITEPQDPVMIRRNIIGGDKWQQSGEWIRYEFTVPEGEAGLYTVVARFKQDISDGVFTSRQIKIDGKIPYAEAMRARYPYGTSWQVNRANIGDTEEDVLEFYLDEGTHTIEFMATLGEFGSQLSKVRAISAELNNAYLEIMRLTGAQPDQYRDYGFGRIMPDVIAGFSKNSEALREVVEYIEQTSGQSSTNAHLETMIKILDLMSYDEHEIAKNLSAFSSAVGSLASWVQNYEQQPLTLDYILIQGKSAELPSVNSNAIESLTYEFKQFIGSFYYDYNSLGATSEDEEEYEVNLTAWTSLGRDQAQIARNLIGAQFCPQYKIGVTVNIVDAAALLPSILAGVGPDLSLDSKAADPNASSPIIDYALRGAALPIEGYEGFEEVKSRFNPETFVPLELYGHTYGIPTGLNFNMMFVRTDVLSKFGLEIPETWDDLLEMVPVLQYNNMDVGMPIPTDYRLYLYQTEKGDIWEEFYNEDGTVDVNDTRNGWRTTFDRNDTLKAFEEMCEMFTQYSLPVAYNAETRFKDGGMPVIIATPAFYTTLVLFSPELAGLWRMVPIPGTVQEDGSINYDCVCSVSALMMIKGCRHKEEAFKFMAWFTDKDYQVGYANELVALLGESAKSVSPNYAAMEEMPWTVDEKEALLDQMKHLRGIPAYPGYYIIPRYLSFAFQAAYSEGADPSDRLLSYVHAINAEIDRKRKEFDFPLYSEAQKAAESTDDLEE